MNNPMNGIESTGGYSQDYEHKILVQNRNNLLCAIATNKIKNWIQVVSYNLEVQNMFSSCLFIIIII